MTVAVETKSKPVPAVSPRLALRLRQVADRGWVMRVSRGIFQAAVLTLVVWLVVVLPLGIWPGMALGVRIPLAVLAWGITGWGVIRYLFPAFRKQTLRGAAREVDAALPALQERISSAVELSQESDPRFGGSPELISHLLRQAEADAQELDPFVVVSGKMVWRWALLLVGVLAIWGIMIAAYAPAIGRGLFRTAVPWSVASLVQPAQYKVDPGNVDVPQGDPVQITAEILIPEQEAEELKTVKLVATYPGGQSAAQLMQRTGPRTFTWQLDHALQSFTYEISSERGDSPLFTVRALSRPAIERLEVQYMFPAYTQIPPRTETDKGGNIDAVVGTKIKLTLHANQPLTTRSRLVIGPQTPDQQQIVLERTAGGENTDYGAEFPLDKPGHWEYVFQLSSQVGQQELTNGGDAPRSILVRADQPPTIAITSPAPEIRIRPDDGAQVTYDAADDFAVARLSAVVQVDGLTPRTLDLPVDASHPRQQGGIWKLSVPEQLSRQGVTAAQRITYQLKATDNCVPPHETLTAKCVLQLDAKADLLASRQAEERARDFAQAVERAENQLQAAQERIKPLAESAANKPLTAQQTRSLDQARQEATDAAKNLADAAAHHQEEAPLKDLAKSAGKIGQDPVKPAADALARAQMASDQPAVQRENIQEADKQMAAAREQLNALHQKMMEAESQRQLQEDVEGVAQKQKELAQAIREGKVDDPQVRQKQEEARQQLEKVMREHPELDSPDKQALAPRAQELARQVEEMQKAQQAMNNPAPKNPNAPPSPQEIAQQQEKLNQEINDFAQKQSQALQSAGAQKPDPREQAPIARELQDKKLSDAAQAQKEQADKLRQTADKMQKAAEKEGAANPPATDPKKLSDQVQQLGQEIQKAKEENRPPSRPGDAANQRAQDLAQQIQKQAAQAAARNPAGRQAAEDARKAAQDARQAASQGKAEEAQQKLSTAAEKLQQAAGDSGSSPAQEGPSQEQMRQAAQGAKELADRQEKLAQQTAEAQKNPGNGTANQNPPPTPQQLAQQMDRAAEQARQMQRQTESSSPQMSQRAGQAAQALQDAARQQRQAGEPGQTGSAQGQQAMQNAERQLAQAQQAAQDLSKAAPGQAAPGESGGHGTGAAPAANQTQQRLAQSLQQARTAQQRAAQGDSTAAGQAAEALAQASESLAKSDSNSSAATLPSGIPSAAGAAGGGMAQTPSATPPPATANTATPEEIGISPGDWARLPPAMQQQLLNAAQQKGPPAYQEMIKNYYTHISRMSAANPEPAK